MRDSCRGPRGTDAIRPNEHTRADAEVAATTLPDSPNAQAMTRRWIPKSFTGRLLLVVLGGFLVRVAYVFVVRHDAVAGDGWAYHFSAVLLAEGHGYVLPPIFSSATPATALHPPLWTTFLAIPSLLGFRSWLDHQLLSVVLGTATVAMVGIAGRRIAGARAGLLAAAIAAVYAGLWLYEQPLLSETLVFPLAALLLYLAYRFRDQPSTLGAATLGAVCGLLALTRSEEILLVVLLVAPIVLLTKVDWRRRIAWLALAMVATFTVIVPWTLYNLSRFERPVLLSTNLGNAMAAGNCDAGYSGPLLGFWHPHCASRAPCVTGPPPNDESAQNYRCIRASLDYIGSHLDKFPIVALARIGRTFGLFRPFQQIHFDREWRHSRLWVDRLGLFSYWLLLPVAVYGAVVLRGRGIPVYPLFAFVVTTSVAVAFTLGFTRFRAPAEISIVLLAGVGADGILRRLVRRHPESAPLAAGGEPA